MKKKLLLLITAVLLSMGSAFAQGGTTGPLTWQLTGTAPNLTLTISGVGAMPDYNSWDTPVPWLEYRELITTVVIETGVTSIGDDAFFEFHALNSVTLGNSITTIGYSAFRSCTSLSSVIIPNSVTNIKGDAFHSCYTLSSVTLGNSVANIGSWAFSFCAFSSIIIPNSVTTIGEAAFCQCTSLISITIPNSVTTIGDAAFARCTSLISIDVENGNANFSSIDGVLFNKEKTILIYCPGGKTHYTIPNGVNAIGNSAFSGSAIISVTIPNSVTTIGNGAFGQCLALTSITIPNSVTTIGGSAFYFCVKLNSVTLGNSVTNIEGGAFFDCYALISITIPNSVTSIGDYAFSRCTSLISIDVENENANYISLDGILFNKEKTILICYPAGKTSSSYTIPNSVTHIGEGAFGGSVINSVTIPNSVATIGHQAFVSCSALTLITNLNPEPIDISTGVYVFPYVNISACTLKVPTSAVFAYENAEVWKDFNIIGGGILVNPISGNPEQGYTIGEGLYQSGKRETATVTAVPYDNYKFVNWTKNGVEVSTDNPYSFTVTEDIELVANFEEVVGIEKFELSNLKIYPNPTTGQLKIESEEMRIENVEIFDVFGKKVLFRHSLMSPETVINISHLPGGVYFVRIQTEAGEMIKKVLKE